MTFWKLHLVALTGLASGLAPSTVTAQTPDCKEPQTQTEMNICAGEDYKKADAELNAEWPIARDKMRELDSNLPDDLKGAADALLAAQRAWIAYRDARCISYGFIARGGTMEPMLVAGCKAGLTRERTKQLKELVDLEG